MTHDNETTPRPNDEPGVSGAPAATSSASRRRPALLVLLVLGLAGAGGGGYWWWKVGQFQETTENAYVGGNVIAVSSQLAGNVVAVAVDDTQRVDPGQELVRLDATDFDLEVAAAEAALADAVRSVRGLYANRSQAKAQVGGREADLARARADVVAADAAVERAQSELARREVLVKMNFVSRENLQSARSAAQAAMAQRDAAQAAVESMEAAIRAAGEQYRAARELVDRVDVAAHPKVLVAAARVREAWVARLRTAVCAPVGGYVAKRSVQVGQRVSPGAALLSIVPADQMWVDANFKEGQLAHVRIGQPVRLHADLYGTGVDYHGRIVGLAMGTGTAFSLLPAQNATGNWIKIVQRVPVRVSLDPAELAAHPLRIGLSMQAEIDTRDRSGAVLATAPAAAAPLRTDVYEVSLAKADERVARIIAQHRAEPH